MLKIKTLYNKRYYKDYHEDKRIIGSIIKFEWPFFTHTLSDILCLFTVIKICLILNQNYTF